MREQIKLQRKESLKTLDESLLKYESIVLMNPSEAEEQFDKSISVSMKRGRVISESQSIRMDSGLVQNMKASVDA